MKKLLSLVIILFTLGVNAQFCPYLGPDQILPCGVGSTTLTADLTSCVPGTNPNQTTSYGVSSIPYVTQTNTGTNIFMTDDSQAGPFPIGFNFCFFGNTYTQFYIGSNGWISFSAGMPTTFTSVFLPNAGPTIPKNCIMGPWQDWHPGLGGQIKYQTQGVAPCRKLIVSWVGVPMFSCTGTTGTFHIVIHESTNLIENFIENKQFCAWSGGTAVQGIHNITGTVAVTVPGRNSTIWTATNDAYRYTPTGPVVVPVLTWYQIGSPTAIGTGTTITVTPPPGGAQYTCRFVYPICNTGWSVCNPVVGPGPDTVLVIPTPPLSPPLMTLINPNCNGSCDGTATITPIVPSPGYTYLWSTGDITPTITGLCAGTYTVNADDGNGCLTSGSVTLIDPPLLVAPPILTPPTVCYQSSSETYSVLPIGPGIIYTWVTVGSINSGQGTESVDLNLSSLPSGITTNAVGVFITDVNGCVSDTVFVDVDILNIDPTIDPIGPFCSNDNCVDLVGDPIGGTFNGIGVTLDTFCPDMGSSNITYTYIQSGCTFDTTILVISNQQPTISGILPSDLYIQLCEIEEIENYPITYITQTDIPGYDEWLFNGQTFIGDLSVIYTTPGTYPIEVVHYSNGCPSEPFNVLVVVGECPSLIYYIPNSFTPDGNEFNQVWRPIFTKGFDPYDFHLTIFNRWGQLIWESYDASVGWDGTYNGKEVQDGIYVWRIEFGDPLNDSKYLKFGNVNVIR
jgi:gliding motility-associated-like protein